MAELLLQMHHGIGRRVRGERDWVSTKRGDVICVHADGWQWGYEECMSEHFRVVCFPGRPEQEYMRLVESAMLGDYMLAKRRRFIDLDAQRAGWLRDVLALGTVMRLDAPERRRFMQLVTDRPVGIVQRVYRPMALNGV